MPTVISAARAGPAMPETTNRLAPSPPRNARRESESLVMDNLLDGRNVAERNPGGRAYLMLLPSFRRPRFPFRKRRNLRWVAGIPDLGIARQHRPEIEFRVAALIQQRAMFHGAEMMIHHGDRSIGIAAAQRSYDRAMLVDGTIGGMRPSVKRKDQGTTRHHLTEITPQQPVARHLSEFDMEFAGKPDRNRCLASLSRRFFLTDMAFEFGAQFPPPPSDHHPAPFPLDRSAPPQH